MGARILVVDDSNTIRRVVTGILARNGYEPIGAFDGLHALELLQSGEHEPIDLVLLDHVMPRMTGYEFCHRVRADEKLRHLPVVLMSAKADKIRSEFVEQTGAIDALSKPFDARALLVVVEGALERLRSGKAPREAPGQIPSTPPPSLPPPRPSGPMTEASPSQNVSEFAQAIAAALATVFENRGESERPSSQILAEAAERAFDAQAAARLLPLLERQARGAERREVLRGEAEAVPLGEVLQVLQMQQQSGELVIKRGETEVSLHFRKGLVDLAGSRGASEEFLLGRYFVEEGLVDRETLELVARESTEAGRLLGDALVSRGVVSVDALQTALTRQTSELIYEVLRWQRASYTFYKLGGEDSPRAADAQLGLPIASLVMEGFRRVDEWRIIEELIDFDSVLYVDQAALDRLGRERLGRLERMVLDAVNGERSVHEIVVQSSVTSFEACKILYQMMQSRLIRRRVAAA